MENYISKNIRHWLMNRPMDKFTAEFNQLNKVIWHHPVRLDYDSKSQTITVDDGHRQFSICRNRRVQRYYNGIDVFLKKLCFDYMIDNIPLTRGDVVIDCGANVGEVSVGLKNRQPDIRIIAVEPEELEANCADLNVFGGARVTLRQALWNEDTTLRFYNAADTADSSVFETAGTTEVKEVKAVRLDTLLSASNVSRVRLLKLEAEGAEPEILEGAESWLSRIDYIAADLGPERGLKQQQTATPAINYLLARGFDLIDMRFDRVVCLFKNRLTPI